MKIITIITKTLLIILFITILVTLSMGGFMPLFSIAFGFLFLYYLLIYILILVFTKRKKQVYKYIICFLLIIPLLFMLIDMESFFDFLLQGISIDMK